uniref:Lateral signaling target protein 2 homolog n=1 Tax=Anisakis simplex TaxID=6269 RepID=A0A0M3K378_ANISI
LLRVVTREELRAVELALCSGDSAVSSTVALQQCDAAGVEERPWADTFTICDFKQTTATVCSRSHIHPKKSSSTNAAQNSMPNINSVQSSTPNVDIDINSTNTNSHASNSPECDVNSSDTKPSSSSRPHSQSQLQSSSKTEVELTRREATASSSLHHYNEESDENDSSANNSPSPSRIAEDSCAVARRILSPTESASSLCDLQPSNNDNYNAEKHLIVSISAAGVDKNVADQSHVSGNNNCGATNAHALRARFRSSADIVHRLFVCIAGVADQLQTNYPADVRKVLKMVLQPNDVVPVYEVPGETASQPVNEEETGVEVQEALPLPSFVDDLEGVRWVPDSDCEQCTACATAFTLVRRRHHCRNCGRIFCSRCSANSLPLPELGYDRKVRVCNLCFLYKINPFSPCQPIPMGNSSAATVQHQPPQIHSSRNQNQQHAHLDSTFHMPGDATYNTVTSSSATTHSTSQAS